MVNPVVYTVKPVFRSPQRRKSSSGYIRRSVY